MRKAFVKKLAELAKSDSRIMLITADLGFGILDDFAARFPKQYLNVGVAEQNMTGIATGMALEGRIVFTYSIANFPTLRCLEQIRNDAAYHSANVKVVAIGGGFSYGPLGFSHHATEDFATMRAMPNMTVVAPCDQWESEAATEALVAHNGPAYLRLDKTNAEVKRPADAKFKLGQAEIVREGTNFTLIASGGILGTTLEAARKLSELGVECRVLNMHTIKPIDVNSILDAALNTGGIGTVEEHVIEGGLGGSVAEVCIDAGILPKTFHRFAIRGGFCTSVGSQSFLRDQSGIGERSIISTVLSLVKKGSVDVTAEAL